MQATKSAPCAQLAHGFLPMLLRTEVSVNLVNPQDDIWVTCWWQNVGDTPSPSALHAALDMVFGYQRTVESNYNNKRIEWEMYPGAEHWAPGAVWATTGHWHIPGGWGGTFQLYLSLCDADQVPVTLLAKDQTPAKRVYIGDVEVGWGLGAAVIQREGVAICLEFNAALPSPAPVIPATIEICDGVTAVLQADQPVLRALRAGQIAFNASGQSPDVFVRARKSDSIIASFNDGVTVTYTCVSSSAREASYRGVMSVPEQNAAVTFTLTFALAGRQLTVTLVDTNEVDGYELLQVCMPSLITVDGPSTHLVDFFDGGRLIDIAKSRPFGTRHPYDVRNAGAIYNTKGTVVVETPGLDDKLCSSIQENAAGRSAVLGAVLTAKVRAYGELASIPVINPPCVKVNVLDACFGAPGWQSAARFLRQDIHPNAYQKMYHRTVVNKFLVTYGPQPEPWQLTEDAPEPIKRYTKTFTFAQALERMRNSYRLLDGGPQVFYITGCYYHGFDTGYPYMLEIDPRVGTAEEARQCIDDGLQYNALVGMHDNYDDCYFSPYYKDELIATDPYGKLWRGWIWAGGLSYIGSVRKFIDSGHVRERVKKTRELFGIRSTYHLDVLTSEVCRYDFDPACPTAADASLLCKQAIVKEFNKYDIDITSETLTHPFVGHIGYAWSTRDNPTATLFPGERYIPFSGMIYHGTIPCGGAHVDKLGLLWGMLRGANAWYSEAFGEEKRDVQGYYLLTLPNGFVDERQIADIIEDGTVMTTIYDKDNYVKVDFATKSYDIVIDGRLVGHNWTTFAPAFTQGGYLAYGIDAGPISYLAPEGWQDGMALRAVTLTINGDGDCVPCNIKEGMITIDVPAGVPVRVTPA